MRSSGEKLWSWRRRPKRFSAWSQTMLTGPQFKRPRFQCPPPSGFASVGVHKLLLACGIFPIRIRIRIYSVANPFNHFFRNHTSYMIKTNARGSRPYGANTVRLVKPRFRGRSQVFPKTVLSLGSLTCTRNDVTHATSRGRSRRSGLSVTGRESHRVCARPTTSPAVTLLLQH